MKNISFEASFNSHCEVRILVVQLGEWKNWKEFDVECRRAEQWAASVGYSRTIGRLRRLAPPDWREWQIASPVRGDSAFEYFSWMDTKKMIRFRFVREAESVADAWATYEPHRKIRGVLGLKSPASTKADDDEAAMAAAVERGGDRTRCATRTLAGYNSNDVLAVVVDSMLVDVCLALHAEARPLAIERLCDGSRAWTAGIVPTSPLDDGHSALQGRFLLKVSRELVPSSFRANTGLMTKAQRGRRGKLLADLALLAGCCRDALVHSSRAIAELKAVGDVHWQAGALVTWCAAAAVALAERDLGAVSTAVNTAAVELSAVEVGLDADDENKCRSLRHACGCVEACAAEARACLRKLGRQASQLTAELAVKVARFRLETLHGMHTANVAAAVGDALWAVGDGSLGADEASRAALMAGAICSRAVTGRRKAAVFATVAAQHSVDLRNWLCAVLAWHLAKRCARDGWAAVFASASVNAVVAAHSGRDLHEIARSLGQSLWAEASLCHVIRLAASAVGLNALPVATRVTSISARPLQDVAGHAACLDDWIRHAAYGSSSCPWTPVPSMPPYIISIEPTMSGPRAGLVEHLPSHDDDGNPDTWQCLQPDKLHSSSATLPMMKEDDFYFDPFARDRALHDAASAVPACDRMSAVWVSGERCSVPVTVQNPLSMPMLVVTAKLAVTGGKCVCHLSRSTLVVDADEAVTLTLDATPLQPWCSLKIVGVIAGISHAHTASLWSSGVFLAVMDAPPVGVPSAGYGNFCLPLLKPRALKPRPLIYVQSIVSSVPPQPRLIATVAFCSAREEARAVARPGERLALRLRIEAEGTIAPKFLALTACMGAGGLQQQILYKHDSESCDSKQLPVRTPFLFKHILPSVRKALERSLAFTNTRSVTLDLALNAGVARRLRSGAAQIVISCSSTPAVIRCHRVYFRVDQAAGLRCISATAALPKTRLRSGALAALDDDVIGVVVELTNDAPHAFTVRFATTGTWSLIPAEAVTVSLFVAVIRQHPLELPELEWRVRGSGTSILDGDGALPLDSRLLIGSAVQRPLSALRLRLEKAGEHIDDSDGDNCLTLRAIVANVSSTADIRDIMVWINLNEPNRAIVVWQKPSLGTLNCAAGLELYCAGEEVCHINCLSPGEIRRLDLRIYFEPGRHSFRLGATDRRARETLVAGETTTVMV